MILFYHTDFTPQTNALDKENSHHCIKVMRKQLGDIIFLTDGKGGLFKAQIIAPHPTACQIDIIEHQANYQKRDYYIHIAIAPTKNMDRIEFFVEKAIELGVDEISFLQCERSERKVIKLDRIEKIAESALKQSLKAYFPKLNPIIDFKKFVVQRMEQSHLYIAHLIEDTTPFLQKIAPVNTSYMVLIGPEGDFSQVEVKLALQNSFQAVNLGKSRLRTETAGIATCAMLNFVNELL
jgi:16S rRNA (uracil1498-N3)-methyltransferase